MWYDPYMTEKLQTGVLIYDGECPICMRAVRWVRKYMVPGSIDLVACQAPERLQRFPEMPQTQCMTAMQFVLPDGRTLAGTDALPHILRRMRRWRWFAWILELPGIRHLAPYIYRWVARNRYTLSVIVTPKGSKEGPACDINNRENCE
jgi:predicted DCC family thiol-disulfide oxidoreductase YuxK